MKKEEVLERSRKEKNDEREKIIDNKAGYVGLFLMDILFLILYAFSNNEIMNELFDAFLGMQLFGEFGYRFLKQRRFIFIFFGLLGLVLSAYGVLRFFDVML